MILYYLLFSLTTEDSIALNNNNHRQQKIFNIFQVTYFSNSECTASDGSNGTCFSRSECSGLGGLASGSCAAGFGTCCVLSSSGCGSTVSRNLTYIRNPGYPSAYTTAGTCEWSLEKSGDNICKIRLDFDTMEIADPVATSTTNAGTCSTDIFTGTRANTGDNTPPICGLNTGQHIYLDAGEYSSDQAKISFSLSGNTERKWNILVRMIECSSVTLPPTGCLQYFTGSTGTVTSFNYRAGCTSQPCTHLQAQRYTSCIRQEAGYCSIAWKADTADTKTFDLSGGANRMTSSVGNWCEMAASNGGDERGDYVLIPNAQDYGVGPCRNGPGNNAVISETKFCGRRLSCWHGGGAAELISKVTPFTLGVVMNENEDTADLNRGFKLNYRQILC